MSPLSRIIISYFAFNSLLLSLPYEPNKLSIISYAYGSDNNDVLDRDVALNLSAAEKTLKSHQYKQAENFIQQALKYSKNVYDRYIIDQVAIAVALEAKDYDTAFLIYDDLSHNPKATSQQKKQFLLNEIALRYKSKDYSNIEKTAHRYIQEFGTDENIETNLIQSLYIQKKWLDIVKEAKSSIQNALNNNKKPSKNILQFFATASGNLHDLEDQNNAYSLLLKYYPSKIYWQNLIYNLMSNKDISPRLVFNLQRLRVFEGMLTNPQEYQDMTERAIQAGMPQLALNLLNYGFSYKILTKGTLTQQQEKFKKFVIQKAYEKDHTLQNDIKNGETEDTGNTLLTAGYNMVLYNKKEGLALMRSALKKPFKHPSIALLEYGMAEMDAGNLKDAIITFKNIPNGTHAYLLGQLWSVALTNYITSIQYK